MMDKRSSIEESKEKKEEETQIYNAERVVGNGSFGVVYQASVPGKNQQVAIKKVYQDKRYKNRELQIMKQLHHPCVIKMRHAFYTKGTKQDQLYLNLVMDYIPETVYRVMKHYNKQKQYVPNLLIKLYAYQMCRSLAYIHALGITHRDIKPQNLLIDPSNHTLKLCDFGSAKKLVRGEPSVSYICSRYYRAPQLIFGATDYSHPIDIWSMGCVIAQLMLGQPLFPGDSGVDQLVEIIKILGTPTKEQIKSMNPNYTEFKFPQIRAHPWNKVSTQVKLKCSGRCCFELSSQNSVKLQQIITLQVFNNNNQSLELFFSTLYASCIYYSFKQYNFHINKYIQVFRSKTSPDAIDLVSQFLVYDPQKRIKPMQALLHPFFDELRDQDTKLPNQNQLPKLFDFTQGKKSSPLTKFRQNKEKVLVSR